MSEKKTIGELAYQASCDTEKYCSLEVGESMASQIEEQVWECIARQKDKFEGDFCVVMLIASDPLLKNMIRRKFYAWPFLPKPRTSQTVWYYHSKKEEIQGLWCLPAADAVATLSIMCVVDKQYKNMKRWSDYLYTKDFWKLIRKESNISMLSEEEHLDIIRKEGTNLSRDDLSPVSTDPIDRMQFYANQVPNS